jgi:hypothetical protein
MDNPNISKIGDAEYVRKDTPTPGIYGAFVIVRCLNAGVHAGTLVKRDGEVLELANSRRLWRWWSKFSLSGLATEGPLPSKLKEQRFACVLPMLTLTTSDVCEVIPCTQKAKAAIMEVPEWINE